MFWISYCVTFALASAIAIVFVAIRLVLLAATSAFGSFRLLHKRNAAGGWGAMSRRSRSWSPQIRKAD
jgi:uncharacterized membrane protein